MRLNTGRPFEIMSLRQAINVAKYQFKEEEAYDNWCMHVHTCTDVHIASAEVTYSESFLHQNSDFMLYAIMKQM